jgi:transposase
MRNLATKMAAMIRIDAVWLAVAPQDMSAGMDTALARVITVFGSAQPIMPTSSPIAGQTA